MDNATRLQYLAAMGIDVWVPRYAEQEAKTQALVIDSQDDSWDLLNAQMRACQLCALSEARQQVLVGSGNSQAEWLWVTEAPSLEDEQQGMPFADEAGELFTEMLRAMQLSRDEVFVTHIVKCRPAEDHDPKVAELNACAPFLARQISLIKPKVIVAVGRIAAHQLLQSKTNLSELRDSSYEFSDIPLVVMYHPAYLLRSLTKKREAWQDMQRALGLFSQQ
ncbi:MAG: uracil-DNA glycosylase [Methyloprofundus sp.]|nr:uracil-DNA glycosylase [Methyloprofundus sp.]MBW6452734.1 uracil-DNA glycosylase [Methyloprofundus sp.]